MRKVDLVRAWKDPVYRASLTEEELAGLAAHPSGILELPEDQLKTAAGGFITTYRTCTLYTSNQPRGCCGG
jgi:mersacidin/lichenicidin family type 2 lantibiotic